MCGACNMQTHACLRVCVCVCVCVRVCVCACVCTYVCAIKLPPQFPTLFALPPAAGKLNRCVTSIFLLCMLTFHIIIQPSPAKLINWLISMQLHSVDAQATFT